MIKEDTWAQTTSVVVCAQRVSLQCLAALSDVRDVGVLTESWWWWWKGAERWCQCCRENEKKMAPLFLFGCANMTKWSVRSPKVYKHSLLLVIPRARPHFNYVS
jgi:hypothetical protein